MNVLKKPSSETGLRAIPAGHGSRALWLDSLASLMALPWIGYESQCLDFRTNFFMKCCYCADDSCYPMFMRLNIYVHSEQRFVRIA